MGRIVVIASQAGPKRVLFDECADGQENDEHQHRCQPPPGAKQQCRAGEEENGAGIHRVMQFGMATHGVVAKAIASGSDADMDVAIETLEKRVRLYEVVLDRILGLPDGSIRISEPGYVRAVMTARRRTVEQAPSS